MGAAAVSHSQAVNLLDALQVAQAALYTHEDTGPVSALLHADVRWEVSGASQMAGRYDGREAVLEHMLRQVRLAGHAFRVQRRAVLVGDGYFAALHDGEAVIRGRFEAWVTVGVYETDGEVIISCRLAPFHQEAFDAIWAPPAFQTMT